MTRIYLDHAATSPLRPEAAEAMRRGFEIWANPSSPHAEGRKARATLEDARARVKAALGWEGECVFTSGASEALAIGLGRAVGDARFISAVEHDAVFAAAPNATVLAVQSDGCVDPGAMREAIGESHAPVVAIQWVNSETGNAHDLDEYAAAVRKAGGLFVVDCAQGAGKFRLPLSCDMAIVSAHKFGGPIGIGALLVRDFAMLVPSGGHERGYRRGTENLPAALGMAAALEAAGSPYLQEGMEPATRSLEAEIRSAGGTLLDDVIRCPTMIKAIAMPHLSAKAQLMRFDMAGIAVSQGSACSSGTMKPSHVLTTMGVPDAIAENTIRVSFGWSTTPQDVERFCETWLAMAREAAERAA